MVKNQVTKINKIVVNIKNLKRHELFEHKID